MNIKKHPNADLENKRSIFFAIGLIIASAMAYFTLEYKSRAYIPDYDNYYLQIIDDDDLPEVITREKKEIKKEKEIPAKLNVVDDEDLSDMLDETLFADTEIDPDEAIIPFEPEPIIEDDEPLSFFSVESPAKFEKYRNETDKAKLDIAFKKEMIRHVLKHFNYPEKAREMNVQGRVLVSFIIESNGIVSNVKVVRGVNRYLDEEAVRIIEKLPTMIPARQRDKAVRVSFIMPISFVLQ